MHPLSPTIHLPLFQTELTNFQAQAIRDSIRNSRTPVVASNGKEYPDYFGNNKGSANGKVFPNIPDSSNLYGQPLSDPAWTGNFPSFLFDPDATVC